METLIIYLIGWFILSIGYYIYKVYIDKDIHSTKKLHAWRAFWIGMWSWIGIIFVVIFCVIGIVIEINECIENKLNK